MIYFKDFNTRNVSSQYVGDEPFGRHAMHDGIDKDKTYNESS